ncbi:glutamate carboxypeptidase 2 homolog [Portunus trituberculatus]|uniref:glutamate carboxypeptidase 2 homolog n=1 Tax=Portunus trituberculatus TaxID=210409 RepID=UPI001E1CCDD1|nr:glutamate carboxypeptidase 2 homolog [Portunus trituberculatus]
MVLEKCSGDAISASLRYEPFRPKVGKRSSEWLQLQSQAAVEVVEDIYFPQPFLGELPGHPGKRGRLVLLTHLTSEPHTAGTKADTQQAQWVAEQWRDQGLDTVNLVPYDVLLSYPHPEKTNTVSVKNGSGHVVWESQGRQPPLWPGEDHPGVLPSFNAYSAPGLVQGPVVYAFLGRDEDFRYLDNHNVSVSDSIVLVRYGDVYRGNQVLEAEKRGAGGVLLFLDPGTVSPEGQDDNHTYPNTVFSPPHAAQLGTTMMGNGDPLTPFYPSIESAFRIPEDEAAIPKIPVQPLSYSDAAFLLRRNPKN